MWGSKSRTEDGQVGVACREGCFAILKNASAQRLPRRSNLFAGSDAEGDGSRSGKAGLTGSGRRVRLI